MSGAGKSTVELDTTAPPEQVARRLAALGSAL
jgi:hypothetical protein